MARHGPIRAAHTPPPVCPKCGSHRTEVVGMIDAPPALVVRCNVCGARSIVPLDEKESRDKPTTLNSK
jgi:hypothetical protein